MREAEVRRPPPKKPKEAVETPPKPPKAVAVSQSQSRRPYPPLPAPAVRLASPVSVAVPRLVKSKEVPATGGQVSGPSPGPGGRYAAARVSAA